MYVQVLVDNPNSWITPYASDLTNAICELGHAAKLTHHPEELSKGDVLCLLSCEKIFKKLCLNKYNLVVHESGLPKGKGWSPLTWQVLEGKNEIPITLFEASDKVDNGKIYLQEMLILQGHELIDEIRHQQGEITIKLILQFIKNIGTITGKEQLGESTYYPRRTVNDSQLDIQQSIYDQFNLLRIVDNRRYPAFFVINGIKYILKIEKSTF
jgi:methionyl-tRNA formyltransferase